MAKSKFEALKEEVTLGRTSTQIRPSVEDTILRNQMAIQYNNEVIILKDVVFNFQYDSQGNVNYIIVYGKDARGNTLGFIRQIIRDSQGNVMWITEWQKL